MNGVEKVRARYQRFADRECKGYSPAYYELSHSVALQDELMEFLSRMPDQQPNLFLAAVQYLTGPEHMPTNGVEMNTFVEAHRDEVTALLQSRHTQTNEVGRCSAFLPALPPGPVALIEVGSSAGLCLMLDKFHYDYGSVQLGDNASPVKLRCVVKGGVIPRFAIPEIVWRCGLDIDPIDLDDPADARWLLSCVWPDHPERRRRLEAAMELWKKYKFPVRRGDLVDDLPDLLAAAPASATLVVLHCAVLPYVSAGRREDFARVLSDFSKQRKLLWLSNEAPGVLSHIDAVSSAADRLQFLIGRTTLDNGIRDVRLLARAHAHGADLEWLDA
jgi:hypothetical protein